VLPERTRFRDPAKFTRYAPVLWPASFNRRFDTGPDNNLDSELSSQLDDFVS